MNWVGAILEDCPERAAIMYQRMPKDLRDRIFWCTQVSEMIGMLRDYKDKLQWVSLSHDLTGDQTIPSHPASEKSGMEVVRYLEHTKSELTSTCKFIVHSSNLEMAFKMTRRLQEAGYKATYIPFWA